MKEEFNLSEKITTEKCSVAPNLLHIDWVKEFIKRLKEGIKILEVPRFAKPLNEFIDKLAGDKLIK